MTQEQLQQELAEYDREQSFVAGIEQLRFFPLVVEQGTGAILITPSGRELVDFSASWTASSFGHAHPALIAAAERGMRTGAGASVLSSAVQSTTRLAKTLLDRAPVRNPERVYLGLAGTDANATVIRAARANTGRKRVLSFEGSYHGGLGDSQAVSGMQPEGDPDRVLIAYPTTETQLVDVETHLRRELDRRDVACAIVETVQCDGGVIVPVPGFLKRLEALCRETDTLLVIDDVKVGLGRTGTVFSCEHESIQPDVITLGKSLGGGLPCSAAIGPASMLDAPQASALMTLAGNPASSETALAVLSLLDQELLERIITIGQTIRTGLSAYRESGRPGSTWVHDIRGIGALSGIEIAPPNTVASTAATTTAADAAALTVYRAWELGCVLYVVRDNVLEITPPYVITDQELELGIDRLSAAIDDVAQDRVDRAVLDRFQGW